MMFAKQINKKGASMPSLSNLSIKVKVLSLFLIPALALIYQVSVRSLEEYTALQENKVVKNYVELSVALSSVVHESQKERGMTAAFVGTGGKKFIDELPKQRKETDAKANTLRLKVQYFQKNGLLEGSSQFKSDLTTAMDKLSNLQSIRSKVTALSIPKAKAIAFYTTMNKMMIDTIASITKESSDPAIINGLVAYVGFLRAKEYMGIERAVGTGAFASKSMNAKLQGRFFSLRAQQKAFFTSFTSLASKHMMQAFKSISSSDIFAKVDDMAKILLNATKPEDFTVDSAEYFKTITSKIDLMKTVEDKISTELKKDAANNINQNETSLLKLLVFNAILVVILLMIGFVVITSITKVVAILQKHMQTIAQTKDLTLVCDMESNDELGKIVKGLNTLVAAIRVLVADAKNSSSENASIAHELSTTAVGVGSNVEKSVSVVETASKKALSIKTDMASSVSEALSSKEDIMRANENLEEAKNEVIKLTSSVQDSAVKESELAAEMERLSGEATQVKEVLNVISDIADQTNLLALNAAIEAARAGEHGRGFAVVADEVRKLAERTQKSLTEINATISVIMQSITNASANMDANAREIQALAEISNNVEEKINETVVLVHEAVNATGITVQSFELSGEGVEAIATQVIKINELSSQNARNVEEIASAAEHLNTMTSNLNMQLETFKTS